MALQSENYSVVIGPFENEPIFSNNNTEVRNDAGTITGASSRKSGKVSASPTSNGDATQKPKSQGKQQKKKSYTKRTILVLIQVLVLLLISGLLIASLISRVMKNNKFGGLEIWKWCFFAISVLCGFALVLWVYWPIMFLIEKAFALNQQAIYFAYGLRKSGAFFIWWLWVMLMWLILMEQRIQKASPTATNVLVIITTRTIISLAVVSFAWVLLTVAIRFLSVKYRFNRYIEKVQDVTLYLDVLRCLAGNPIKEGDKDGKNCCFILKKNNDDASRADNEFIKIHTFKSDNNKLNLLNWDYIFDHANQNMEFSTIMHGISKTSTDEEDGSHYASIIYDNVSQNPSPLPGSVTFHDLSHFILDDKIDLLLNLFSANRSQAIDRQAFTNWVIQVYYDRKMLLQALNDNKSATKQLSVMLRAILVIMGMIAWLLWIDVLTISLLAAFITGIAGGLFIFGESMKRTFQSIMFVFVIHPFDIGDSCIIGNIPMKVEQMNILTTIFLNANNEKTYYPNHVLASIAISNTTRSSVLHDSVPFYIDMGTSKEKIATLKEHIKHNFESKSLSSSVVVNGFDSQDNNIKMTLKFSYKNPAQEKGETTNKRTDVILQLMKILQDDGVRYSFPPTDAINVSTSTAKKHTLSGSAMVSSIVDMIRPTQDEEPKDQDPSINDINSDHGNI